MGLLQLLVLALSLKPKFGIKTAFGDGNGGRIANDDVLYSATR